MATQTTRYADQKIMDSLIRGTANSFPAIANWYVGLLTYANGVAAGTLPNRDNVVELNPANLASYARVPLGATSLTPVDANNNPAFVTNSAQWLFAEATEDWGAIVGIVLCDAAAGGNQWWMLFPDVANQRTIRKGDRLNVPAGEGKFQGGSTN